MALEARHPVSIVGDDAPLRVLARGTLIDLGPAMIRVRLDDSEQVPPQRATVVTVVHRTKAEVVLGTVTDGEADPRIVSIARVARAD